MTFPWISGINDSEPEYLLTIMADTLVIFSGGMDSTTLLYDAIDRGRHPLAFSVNYGQRHSRELLAAGRIASQLSLEHLVVDISSVSPFLAGSALTDSSIAVPDGHYASATMATTVVPNRNMIFLSLAAAVAISRNIGEIAYGAHSGDHHIYADCRGVFVEAMRQALNLCHDTPVSLHVPFLDISKEEICRIGARLGVPFETTWSCYKGKERHCGTCGTCVERREAFERAGIKDPTEYLG